MNNETTETTITVPDKTLEAQLKVLAKCLGVSFNNLVQMIIHHHITHTNPSHHT